MSEPPVMATRSSNRWVWILIAVCLLVPVAVCGGLAAGVFFLFRTVQSIEKSELVQLTVQRLEQDVRVVHRLGKPLKVGQVQRFHVQVNNLARREELTVMVQGPNGQARLELVGQKPPAGAWQHVRLRLWFEDGTGIDLLAAPESHKEAPLQPEAP